MQDITIANKVIGQAHPTFIIAELSGNHGGNLARAKEMIRAAANAGADAIKIQVYRPDTITLNADTPDFAIASDNAWAAYKNLYQLYQYAHTPWEWLPELFKEAQSLGIELFGSVFDETSVDELEQYPTHAYKIASPEIVDFGLLEKVAKTGKPVIVSTGLANLTDISAAVAHLKHHGCKEITLLKCTTAYPTPPEEVNLKTIQNIEQTFGCITGLSDHTVGIGVAIAAVALGAKVIEKHIKLDDEEKTVDDFFSLTISEFQQMVNEIRTAEKAIGDIVYDLTPSAQLNQNGRRSLYICKPIKKGEILTEQHIKSVRPGFGLPTQHKQDIIGLRVNRDLTIGDRISWELFK